MRLIGVLSMLILFCINLYAQTAISPTIGNGTVDDPYEIATLENLYWIAASDDVVPDPSRLVRWSSHYIQIVDIDASDTRNWFNGQGWYPIGNAYSRIFNGRYNGENHSIRGLYINRPGIDNVGLFGYVLFSSSHIKNLKLIEADITGGYHVGGIVGQILHSHVTNCYVEGYVNGIAWTGLVVGFARGHSFITNSYSSGYVNMSIQGSSQIAGGLVGQIIDETIMANCFSHADVVGEDIVGGLVGSIVGNSTLSNSYAMGSVSGNDMVGGLIGSGGNVTISNCYSTGLVNGSIRVGGLIGDIGTSAVIFSCFWNTETSGQTSSAAGAGRTTDAMTYPYAPFTYVNWDFDEVWGNDSGHSINDGYPYLREVPLSVDNDNSLIPNTNDIFNYPNPFNSLTTIRFSLTANVESFKLSIYNTKGQLVRTLIASTTHPKGEHQVVWDGRNDQGREVTSGIYFYRMKTPGFEKTNKMLLLK